MAARRDPRYVTLQARMVETQPALGGERTDYRDVDAKGRPSGLLLRVSPTGARSYGVRYSLSGRDARYYIGDATRVALSSAREEARRVLGLVAQGRDPHAEREAERLEAERQHEAVKNAVTVGELAERFLKSEGDRLRENTLRQWRGILSRHVAPTLGDRPAAEITRSDVRVLLERIGEKHPVMANRVLEFVRVVYNWSVEREVLPASPLVGMKKRAVEHSRSRVLSHEEIRTLHAAMEPAALRAEVKDEAGKMILPALSNEALKTAVLVADALRLAFLTGARVSEIVGMPWVEVDLNARLWTVAPSRSKNAEAHPIPLSGAALTLLLDLKARVGVSSWVFPSPRKDSYIRKVQSMVDRIRVKAGLADADFEGFHDVRRTVRTNLAALGVPGEVAEAVLGHAPARLTRTYNVHDYVPQMRVGLEAWSRRLAAIVTGDESVAAVVPITAQRA